MSDKEIPMSAFSFPDSAARLMVHPMAASAAAMAIGVGFAGQMTGMMMGSMTAAFDVSRRMGMPAGDTPAKAKPETRRPSSKVPSGKPGPARKSSSAVSDLKAAADTAAGAVAESALDPANKAGVDAAAAHRQPVGMAKPASPDDLKEIAGIGPKLEQVLNGLGIWTFGQISAWNADEVAWVDEYLQFRGRIERDGWRQQAEKLAVSAQ